MLVPTASYSTATRNGRDLPIQFLLDLIQSRFRVQLPPCSHPRTRFFFHFPLHCFARLCFARLCFARLCFARLCFACPSILSLSKKLTRTRPHATASHGTRR